MIVPDFLWLKTLLAAAATSGFLIFAEPRWLARFGLLEWATGVRPALALILIVAGVLLAVEFLGALLGWLAAIGNPERRVRARIRQAFRREAARKVVQLTIEPGGKGA